MRGRCPRSEARTLGNDDADAEAEHSRVVLGVLAGEPVRRILGVYRYALDVHGDFIAPPSARGTSFARQNSGARERLNLMDSRYAPRALPQCYSSA